VSDFKRKLEEMRRDIDQLVNLANDWEREMINMQSDFADLDRLANEVDDLEKKLRSLN
jgi:hypothetical protein